MIVDSYMLKRKPSSHVTENYVSTPPALVVVEADGSVWTLGYDRHDGPRGEYAFTVLRNGLSMGEVASRIERRQGKIRAYTLTGWKVFNGKSFI